VNSLFGAKTQAGKFSFFLAAFSFLENFRASLVAWVAAGKSSHSGERRQAKDHYAEDNLHFTQNTYLESRTRLMK
jgi:hypothetical protein